MSSQDHQKPRGRRSRPKESLHVQPTAEYEADSTPARHQDTSIHAFLMSLIAIVRRRWKLVVALWLGFFLPMAFFAATSLPIYTARGAVQVSSGSGMVGLNPLMEMMGGLARAEVQTEVEIMSRREFLSDVLHGLGLQATDPNEPSFITSELTVMLGNESPVEDRLRHVRQAAESIEVRPSTFDAVPVKLSVLEKDRIRVEIGEDPKDTAEFGIGESFEHPKIRMSFRERPLAVGSSMELELLPEGMLLESYSDRIRISGLGTIRDPTNIVQVSVSDKDRATAQAIVQAIMGRYLETTLEWQSKSASQTAEFIEGQLEEVRRNLQASEERMLAYSREHKAVQLDTQAEVAIENAAELEAQRVAIAMQEQTIGNVLSRIQRGRSPKASLTANFFEDPVLVESIAALTEAETKYEILSASMTPDHPQVQTLRRALEVHRQEVARLMRSAQRNLASQKKQIDQAVSASMKAMSKYPDTQMELARLTRDMEVSQRLYTLLLEKYEEAEIMKASTTTDKRIVDNASLPHEKTSPRRGRLLMFGALGGLALGIGFAFLGHVLQRRLDTVDAVREIVPYPTYGTVPEVASDQPSNEVQRLTVSNVWKTPHEALPESFQGLGVSVSLLPGDTKRGRLIIVTSSQPGEGKSTITSNLAESLGRTGKKVLLVDLDLRKPVQHRLWGVPREPGYSDLVGRGGSASDVKQIGHKLEGHNTTVLTAGTRLPDTVAAVMAPSLEVMLEEWSQTYGYVILDSPPAFVAEALALAQHADLVLLVARPGVIERSNLRHAIEALERVDVPKGLVLNDVGKKHTEYYYGSGYYYYGSKYGDDKQDHAATA